MSATKNNNIFDKTSFLGSNSSEFMEELYAQYVTNPQGLPEEWKEFFKSLNDNKEEIIKTVNGPSWSRKKRKKTITNGEEFTKDSNNTSSVHLDSITLNKSAQDSIRANTLMRAYRIRGHLLANLDPLRLQEREEHPELKPETYGFKKEDESRKIFVDGILGLQSSNLNEIIKSAKKIYCGNIGYEFMHMADPEERFWIRERIEGNKIYGKWKESNTK